MRAITTPREPTAHWTKMRRSRARFSGSVASCRMPWSGGFITSTPESEFSVRTGALSVQNGQLMLKSDKSEFKRGAAAKTQNDDRYNGKENRTAGSRKSPASLSPVEILSKDRLQHLYFRNGRIARHLQD